MENEISKHQFTVYDYVRKADDWVTASDISRGAKVAGRTARAHALKFVNLGIFDQAEVFPAHQYRFSKAATKRNKSLIIRLEGCREIFDKQ